LGNKSYQITNIGLSILGLIFTKKYSFIIPMSKQTEFAEEINAAYSFKAETMILGASVLNGEVVENCTIKLPFKTRIGMA
jgi:hypothetical protein